MHEPRPATPDEVDLAVDLILRQQQRGDRAIYYLGDDRDAGVGTAIYLAADHGQTPRALDRTSPTHHVLHEQLIVVSVEI